jgi:U3 small nucleolar RNA-associated protein 21
MMLFGEIMIVLLKDRNEVEVRNIVTDLQVCNLVLEFNPIFILHPVTYLNKVLLAGPKELDLYNIHTGNKIFSFGEEEGIKKLLLDADIVSIKNSPAVDIVAIAFSNGRIALVNLKAAAILRVFQQSGKINCFAFSMDITRSPL